eukprot:6297931-Amphidinium_carterae.1
MQSGHLICPVLPRCQSWHAAAAATGMLEQEHLLLPRAITATVTSTHVLHTLPVNLSSTTPGRAVTGPN